LAIGEIVIQLMYGDTNLGWLEEGAARALTLAWSVCFFGADTVPKFHGFTPGTGYDAMQFARKAIGPGGIQPDHSNGEWDAVTAEIGVQLVKAAHFLRRPTTFDPGASDAAAWVASQSLGDMALQVYMNDASLTKLMPTQSQVRVLMKSMLTAMSADMYALCSGEVAVDKDMREAVGVGERSDIGSQASDGAEGTRPLDTQGIAAKGAAGGA
jgi:hypothetical protein